MNDPKESPVPAEPEKPSEAAKPEEGKPASGGGWGLSWLTGGGSSAPTTPAPTEAEKAGTWNPLPSDLEYKIIPQLQSIYDPEIPVNIYDLGLIYEMKVNEEQTVSVKMTLTAPGCPVAGYLVDEVASKIRGVEGVKRCLVELVWDPPWTMDKMTEAARLTLGF